ncbi:MAG: alpha-L-fucosidase [Ginsengibacter sp.]
MKKNLIFIAFIFLFQTGFSQTNKKINPVPTKSQLAWQNMEYYFFVHFGPNTFTGLEWGKGTENAEVFDPKELNCDQWCRIAKAAGATGIMITAKHHDGFCLWPSKYSKHTVRESGWKNGKGDVLKELSASCKKYGLKFGVYLSPWDRNHPAYGTPAYNHVFANMLKEIFTNYGPIWELWWDGANGEGPNGKKQIYDFARFTRIVRKLSPNTIIFSDIGPDARWCGNEHGFAGKTNWDLLDTAGFRRGIGAPPVDTLNQGNVWGKNWIPAECDVSIRPGWFNHKNEDSLVKSPEKLFEIYLKSVGRGTNLILNVPPDGRGLITKYDSASVIGFKKLREESFRNDLSKNTRQYFVSNHKKSITTKLDNENENSFETIAHPDLQSILVDYNQPTKVNCVVLQENLVNGQHCAKFTIKLIGKNHEVIKEITGTTIGHKRILTFPEQEVSSLNFSVDEQKAPTKISSLKTYLVDEDLIEK